MDGPFLLPCFERIGKGCFLKDLISVQLVDQYSRDFGDKLSIFKDFWISDISTEMKLSAYIRNFLTGLFASFLSISLNMAGVNPRRAAIDSRLRQQHKSKKSIRTHGQIIIEEKVEMYSFQVMNNCPT